MLLAPKTRTPSSQIPVTCGTLILRGLLGPPCASCLHLPGPGGICCRPGAACGTEPAGNTPLKRSVTGDSKAPARLGSALCPGDAWWPGARWGSLALQGQQTVFGPCGHLGWILSFLLVWDSFSPLTKVFHYNSSFFRHGKDIPDQQHTSDSVETSCFHKFSPPNYFALRNSSVPPPPPPPSHTASPGGCASSSPSADAACSHQAWHRMELPSPPHAFGTVKMSLRPQPRGLEAAGSSGRQRAAGQGALPTGALGRLGC